MGFSLVSGGGGGWGGCCADASGYKEYFVRDVGFLAWVFCYVQFRALTEHGHGGGDPDRQFNVS